MLTELQELRRSLRRLWAIIDEIQALLPDPRPDTC